MKKVNLILVCLVLMLGLVAAGNRTLYYTDGITVPINNVIAGKNFEASFNFAYLDDFSNPDKSPLIIKLNFSSNDFNYPVWRGDFKVSGYIEKYFWFGMLYDTIYFECNNSLAQTIEYPLDSVTVEADNGTFYCYDENGNLNLGEDDYVYLDITPKSRLYPGSYNLTASMFYLTDERAPYVNITNKYLFEKYYREIDNVLVKANINDTSRISQKWSSVMINGVEVFPLNYNYFENEEYYFSKNTPEDIAEDDYKLFVFAEDSYGNRGNDSVILKIDRTAPVISQVGTFGIESGSFVGVFNIVDEKAGVDNESVEYRLREMNGSNICPENGVGNWDCFNSGWINLDFDSGDTYEMRVNSSELILNGEYWVEVRALDVLGNMGVLE